MKTEVTKKTSEQLEDIRKARKDAGRSDWASHHVLAPLVEKLHKKECGND
tara:strand:+ start:2063 stop:2212 length:150 start_codon:yes stop_codon:yes gene_type:complete